MRQALTFRMAGAGYVAIARQLGYSGPSGAFQAVQKALNELPRAELDELRQIAVAQLDELWHGLYQQALSGHLGATDRLLGILDRKARLLSMYQNHLAVDMVGDIRVHQPTASLTEAQRDARILGVLERAATRQAAALAAPGSHPNGVLVVNGTTTNDRTHRQEP